MPREVRLDELPGLLGDQGIVLRLPAPPPLRTARLMATLGVRIEVTAVSAHDFAATRDCVTPGCPEPSERGMAHCRRHADVGELRTRRENREENGLAALERMDAGEPQVRDTGTDRNEGQLRVNGSATKDSDAAGTDTPAKGKRRKWTREEIIAAIQAWATEHGSPPTSKDWNTAAEGRPTTVLVKTAFGSWATAVEAAGFPRPTRGGGKPKASRPRDQVFVIEVEEPSAAMNEADTAEGETSAPDAAAPETPPEALEEPADTRTLGELVTAYEEADAAAAAAEAAAEEASIAVEAAATAILNHHTLREIQAYGG